MMRQQAELDWLETNQTVGMMIT